MLNPKTMANERIGTIGYTVPVGPSGKTLSELSPSAHQQLKTRLRERLPIAADGSYEAFANAVRGVVP